VVEVFQLLLSLFIVFLSIFLGTYLTYFVYMWRCARRPWKLKAIGNVQPKITVLVPVHNEEKIIESKLRNIKEVFYSKENIEVIVVDDASDDHTLEKVGFFMENNPDLQLSIVKQNPRVGKSIALNKALDFSSNQIVIVSDADTFWPSNILLEALPYLSDPEVGAVTGRSVNIDTFQSWVTKGENIYLRLTSLLRLGESKIHSTIRFEGGFCAYKRDAFKKFDSETGSDDSGTALEVVQNGYRAIMVPEATFYTNFPTSFRSKLKIKVRRANQLISLWVKCLKLMVKRKLRLSRRIVLPELMLFIFNPIILLALMATTLVTIVLFPFSQFSITVMLLLCLVLIFAGRMLIEILLDNLVLFYALLTFLSGRGYIAWEKPS